MMDRRLLISVCTVLLLTCYDLNRSYSKQTSIKNNTQITLEENSSDNLQPTTIKFLFCSSSGYRNVYKQLKLLIETDYPNVKVISGNYPPPWIKSFLARFISIIKMSLLVCLLFGQNPFTLLHRRTPSIYSWALRNKLYACLMIFFFCNSLESYLLSTGAFEIFVNNDVLLWSKLETGRLPSSDEFLPIFERFTRNS